MMALIQDANNSICLIHNHPGSSSLSDADIRAASLPGSDSIEAIGHDDSRYKVKPKITDYVELVAKLSAANDEAMYFMSELVTSKKMTLDAVKQIFDHVKNLALAKSGVIGYEYQLSTTQENIFVDLEIEINKIVDKVVKKLKTLNPLKQESKP
jgi:predicted DNA-binding transcriptional regulator